MGMMKYTVYNLLILEIPLNSQCAVIQLPSQTLLLSVSDKAYRLIGMLFPGVRYFLSGAILNLTKLSTMLCGCMT